MNFGENNGLWQGIICLIQLQGLPADREKLAAAGRSCPQDWQELRLMGKQLGLKFQKRDYEPEELADLEEPVLALMKDRGWRVLGKGNGHRIMVMDPVSGEAGAVSLEEFTAEWSGTCLKVEEPFSLKNGQRRFGLTWFVPVLMKYRHYLLEVMLASFCLQLLGIATPVFTQVIIDKVIGQQGIATLTVLGIALVFAAFFVCGMSIARKLLETSVTSKADIILGSQLMRHLLRLPLRYFEVRRVGDTLTRVSALSSIREFLTGAAITALLDGVFSVVFFAIMAYYSWSLTLLALLPAPLYLLQNILVTPIYKKRLSEYWQTGALSNAFLVETVTGAQTVKALAIEPQFMKRWEKLLAGNISAGFNSFKLGLLINTGTSGIQNFSTLLILLIGGHQVIEGSLTVGQLIAFQMLARQGSEPLFRLSGLWQKAQQTMLSVRRLGDIMNSRPEMLQGECPAGMSGALEFQQVSFAYDVEKEPAVREVSFQIEAGQRVGIVGPSGSGKSTITKLVEQLYLPAAGQVLIDGLPAQKLNRHWLRSRIGVVQQENILFRGSVRENIAFARPGASIEDVMKAAAAAGAHEFIIDLPNGYDTQVGEQGTSLSGGQRQRIAIARALLNNPRLIIFDEATSALDYKSESIVMKNLDKIARGRTMLIIAHRLSTVMDCDKILVLDRGRLVEEGNHEQLMDRQGLYCSLYRQQEVG
ncbi:MAG: type I secretion system permease/ATPase [Anaerovibrio sp.]|nr:type I secretion system permease/ATPase [Anaerovibrio sp.]